MKKDIVSHPLHNIKTAIKRFYIIALTEFDLS